jgi:hypothetical protein
MQSLYFIARAVMTTAYLAGTLFLGMKEEYVEYTPSRDHRDEKRYVFSGLKRRERREIFALGRHRRLC